MVGISRRNIAATAISASLILGGVTFGQSSPAAANDEPRYCDILIEALATSPDVSLFPLNTAKKKREWERITKSRTRLYKKAYFRAVADGDVTASKAFYWMYNDIWGNMKGFREWEAGNRQVKSDCGIGVLG